MGRALLDACVLYPTVLREILLGVGGTGLYQPCWSPRILEEWARAAARRDPAQEVIARGEAAVAALRFPQALVSPDPATEAALDLPDAADKHVLAAAIAAGAPVLVTLNLRDFPGWALGPRGIRAVHPDTFLWELWRESPALVATAVEAVRAAAERISGEEQPVRPLLKRANLPRLGKALAD